MDGPVFEFAMVVALTVALFVIAYYVPRYTHLRRRMETVGVSLHREGLVGVVIEALERHPPLDDPLTRDRAEVAVDAIIEAIGERHG